MDKIGRIALYLIKREMKYFITNWPGTLEFPALQVRSGRHNIAGTRIDVWFFVGKQQWHGVQYGEWTQICHCKRLSMN